MMDNTLSENLLTQKQERFVAEKCLWTWSVYMAYAAVGFNLATLGPTLLGLSKHLDITPGVAGIFFTFRAAGYFTSAAVSEALLKRIQNPATLLFVCTGCCGFVSALVPRVDSYLGLCITFCLQGVVMGLVDVVGHFVLLSVWRESKFLNGVMCGLHLLFGLGSFAAPLCVSIAVAHGLSSVHVWPVAGAVCMPAAMGLLTQTMRKEPCITEDETNNGPMPPLVVVVGCFLFCAEGLEIAFGGYIDPFAVHRFDFSEVAAAQLTALFWGSMCASGFLAAAITPHLNCEWYVKLHVLVAFLAMVVLNVAAAEESGAGPQSIAVATALYGFAMGPLYPGGVIIAEERVAPHVLDGRANAFLSACASLGEMILPLGTGLFFDASVSTFPWLQLMGCVAAALTLCAMSRI